WTGRWTTRPARRWRRSGRSGTRSNAGSAACSPNSASRPAPDSPHPTARTPAQPGRGEHPMGRQLTRALVAEFLGSLLLAAVVLGSGIAAQRLSPADTGTERVINPGPTPRRPRPGNG